MPRLMSSAMSTWLGGSVLPSAMLFQGAFRSGTAYLWTGYGPLVWDGKTYLGIGSLAGISQIDEGTTVEARGIAITLSGLDATMLSDVLTEFQLGLPVTIYLAGFDAGVLIIDPVIAFAGRIDQPAMEIDGQRAVITLNSESQLLQMNIAVDRRYTIEDQQREWPGDLGMNFVDSIQELTLYFGSAPTTQGNV